MQKGDVNGEHASWWQLLTRPPERIRPMRSSFRTLKPLTIEGLMVFVRFAGGQSTTDFDF